MTDDNEFIDEIIEVQEQTAKNIELLADEVGLSKSDLATGASPEEREVERQKAAVVAGVDVEKTDTAESPAEIAAAMIQQNQANVARVAEAAGVSSRKIAGGTGAAPTEKQKARLFGLGDGDDAAKSLSDDDAEKSIEELKQEFFGNPGEQSQTAGDAWQREILSESES